MEWSSNFSDIALASLTAKGQTATGSTSAILRSSGDVEITADNTYNAAQLKNTTGLSTDNLNTRYKLGFDGDGLSDTGASETVFEGWDTFISTGKVLTHVLSDDEVEITLFVEVSMPSDRVCDAGDYQATQTLTAVWAGI